VTIYGHRGHVTRRLIDAGTFNAGTFNVTIVLDKFVIYDIIPDRHQNMLTFLIKWNQNMHFTLHFVKNLRGIFFSMNILFSEKQTYLN